MSSRNQTNPEQLEAIRELGATFAVQLYQLLAPAVPEEYLSMKAAADLTGYTYDVFRRVGEFDAANVAPRGKRKRYARSRLLKIAADLRKTS